MTDYSHVIEVVRVKEGASCPISFNPNPPNPRGEWEGVSQGGISSSLGLSKLLKQPVRGSYIYLKRRERGISHEGKTPSQEKGGDFKLDEYLGSKYSTESDKRNRRSQTSKLRKEKKLENYKKRSRVGDHKRSKPEGESWYLSRQTLKTRSTKKELNPRCSTDRHEGKRKTGGSGCRSCWKRERWDSLEGRSGEKPGSNFNSRDTMPV